MLKIWSKGLSLFLWQGTKSGKSHGNANSMNKNVRTDEKYFIGESASDP